MENDGRKDCSGSVERIICDMPGDREIKKQDKRQMRGNRIILHGSYTVEAAVVCPMIFLVIVLIWYLGAFWHNQIVCQAVCQEAVYAGMNGTERNTDSCYAKKTGSLRCFQNCGSKKICVLKKQKTGCSRKYC